MVPNESLKLQDRYGFPHHLTHFHEAYKLTLFIAPMRLTLRQQYHWLESYFGDRELTFSQWIITRWNSGLTASFPIKDPSQRSSSLSLLLLTSSKIKS